MTLKQLMKKADIARKTGEAVLEDGARLVYHETGLYSRYFALVSKDGNTIDTAYDAAKFDYICG